MNINMKDIHFIILNMNKNKDRWQKMVNILNKLNISYSRMEAIDGFKLEKNNDYFVNNILSKRDDLINKILECKTFNQTWIYDGSIKKSFPGLNINGNEGAKGLILSNMKAFDECIKINKEYVYGLNDDNTKQINEYRAANLYPNFYKYQWFCILEDDAILNSDVLKKIENFLNDLSQNSDQTDIVLLDKRIGGGAAGVLYNSNIICKLRKDLHPLSEFSITMEEKYNHSPLWDWKLWHYVNNKDNNINFKILPCIESGEFVSTIDI